MANLAKSGCFKAPSDVRKYTGVQGWPVIIPEEQYDRANEKRTSKVTPPKKTEAQKVLNRLCRGGPAADAGQVVLQLLNNLIADQEQICTPETPKAIWPLIHICVVFTKKSVRGTSLKALGMQERILELPLSLIT